MSDSFNSEGICHKASLLSKTTFMERTRERLLWLISLSLLFWGSPLLFERSLNLKDSRLTGGAEGSNMAPQHRIWCVCVQAEATSRPLYLRAKCSIRQPLLCLSQMRDPGQLTEVQWRQSLELLRVASRILQGRGEGERKRKYNGWMTRKRRN